MGILTGRADSRAQYEKVWKAHLNDLHKLAFAAGCSQNDAWWAIKEQLDNMLEQAVTNTYGDKD